MIANIGVALSCCMATHGPAPMAQAGGPMVDHDTASHHTAHTQSDQQELHECDCMAACTGMAPALAAVDLGVEPPFLLGALGPVIGDDLVANLQGHRPASARAPPSWT